MKNRNLMKEIKCIEKLASDYGAPVRPFKGQINFTQGHILIYLFMNEDKNVCQKDLENETKLKKASITGTLDSLEDKGLIERVVSLQDKRKNYIVLTDKAKQMMDILEAQLNDINEIAFRGVSDEEMEYFFSIIDKISNNLKGGNE